jgi:hypothetical protein
MAECPDPIKGLRVSRIPAAEVPDALGRLDQEIPHCGRGVLHVTPQIEQLVATMCMVDSWGGGWAGAIDWESLIFPRWARFGRWARGVRQRVSYRWRNR